VKRLLLPLSLLAVAGFLWGSVTPARACYFTADFNPVRASGLIIAGQIVNWRPDPDFDASKDGTRVPIRVRIDVNSTIKGPEVHELELVNEGAVDYVDGAYSWDYGIADCGLFGRAGRPPLGKQIVMGLSEDDDGDLRESFTFFSGDSLDGANEEPWGWSYRAVLTMIADDPPYWALPGVQKEAAANATDEVIANIPPVEEEETDFPLLPAAALAVLGTMAFLTGAAFVWRRGSQRMGSE